MSAITAGTRRILIGYKCERCNLRTNDPNSPRVCPRRYHPMEPVYKYVPVRELAI